MEYTLYSSNQGAGYIAEDDTVDDRFKPTEAVFEFGVLKPGDKTDLGGFFAKEFTYVGRDGNELLFFLGEVVNMLSHKYYYQSIEWISSTRFFMQYSRNAGRDYNWVKGNFK